MLHFANSNAWKAKIMWIVLNIHKRKNLMGSNFSQQLFLWENSKFDSKSTSQQDKLLEKRKKNQRFGLNCVELFCFAFFLLICYRENYIFAVQVEKYQKGLRGFRRSFLKLLQNEWLSQNVKETRNPPNFTMVLLNNVR